MSGKNVFCRNCGATLASEDQFCSRCGTQQESTPSSDPIHTRPAWMSDSKQKATDQKYIKSDLPPEQEDADSDRKQMSAGTIGCGAILGICVLLAVIGAIWGDDSNRGSSSSRSSQTEETMPMRGSIIVFDQRTCAGGARVKVSAGPIWQENVRFPETNSPCNLRVDIKVPPRASSYKIEVGSLPPVILTPSEMRSTDSLGKEFFEVKLIVGE